MTQYWGGTKHFFLIILKILGGICPLPPPPPSYSVVPECILDYLYLDYPNLNYPNTKLGCKQSTIESFFRGITDEFFFSLIFQFCLQIMLWLSWASDTKSNFLFSHAKKLPFWGHGKGSKGHPRLSEFSAYPNRPSINWVQPVWIIKDLPFSFAKLWLPFVLAQLSYWPGADRLLSMNFLFTKHNHHYNNNSRAIKTCTTGSQHSLNKRCKICLILITVIY